MVRASAVEGSRGFARKIEGAGTSGGESVNRGGTLTGLACEVIGRNEPASRIRQDFSEVGRKEVVINGGQIAQAEGTSKTTLLAKQICRVLTRLIPGQVFDR